MTPRPRRRRAALAALLLAATAAAAGCATRPPEQAPAGDIEELFRTEVGAEPLGLARRADGDLLVVAAEGRALSLVDADTGAELKRLDLRDHGRLNRVVAAPEAVYITASVAGRVLVIDPGLSGVEAAIPVGGFPQGMALHGDDRLFVANTASGTVSVVDRGARAVVATVEVGERPQELAVDPERDRLIVLKTTTRSLRVLGLGGLEERAVWRDPGLVRPVDLALTADGGVLVADAGAQALVLFGPGGEVVRRLGLPGGVVTPTALALAQDGRRVAVADRGGSISLLDLDPGGGAAAATVVAPDLRAVLFAPDGRLYATSFGGDALIALAADEG